MKIFLQIVLVTYLTFGIFGLPAKQTKKDIQVKESKHDYIAEDDSDMLMEPNDFTPAVELPETPEVIEPSKYRPIAAEYAPSKIDPQSSAAQNFIPSFFRDAQPLGHSRPYYTQDQQPHRFGGNRAYDQSILGSGDFGVIRGGTFYQDNDPPTRTIDNNDYYSFYNNGHGRPQAAPYRFNFAGDEQFSNFRDFADINTPNDPAYSQFVVVYANKNSTNSAHSNPKNIFEQLQLLDQQVVEEKKNGISKFKTKLANTKLEKKYKKKLGPKETDYEPLLALS